MKKLTIKGTSFSRIFAALMQQGEDTLYEIVVGLEIHARLAVKTKLFSGDSIAFGHEPNIHVSPITLAHPGTLPKMNKRAVEYAVKMGLACDCEIEKQNYFARKNYFYPDLPKGYQVSQHTTPICKDGYITVSTDDGEKSIRLNRIHMEEDAGKSLHDIDERNTAVDYNRAGTPLIEIVTEPDIRSAEEAFQFIAEIRKRVRYLEICDGNMEEGSLRCDANISVRKKGDAKLGTKVEVKNLNSMRHVKKAIEFEAARMIQQLEKGEAIIQQTRSFDAGSNTTFAIRDKEDADDYRYFPEPDLTPFDLTDEFIEEIRKTIPVLQQERIAKYTGEYKLPVYDARVITEEKETADYFEQVVHCFTPAASSGDEYLRKVKAAANWMLGPVKSWMNESGKEIKEFPLRASVLARIILLVDENKLSFSAASGKLLDALLQQPDAEPLRLAEEKDLLQQTSADTIEPVINEVLARFADKVAEYRKGKKGLISLFTGEVMKRTKGKADPKKTSELLLEKLNSEKK